jgi:hypothetical protein
MVDNNGRISGDQFDVDRFEQGQDQSAFVRETLTEIFDARNVTAVEPEEAYDNFTEEKALHQLLDYTGIDYLVDTFHEPLFGVNHRNHFSEDAERFDIRVDTGSAAPSELDKLRDAARWDIVPKYASRLKMPDGDPEWFRVIDLELFVRALDAGLQYDLSWSDGAVEAWMYDYEKLRERGAIVAELSIE